MLIHVSASSLWSAFGNFKELCEAQKANLKNYYLDLGYYYLYAIVLHLTDDLIPFVSCKQLSQHCVKSIQVRSYFWSVFSCIQSEYRKIRTRNNFVFGHFPRSAVLSNFPGISLCRYLQGKEEANRIHHHSYFE